MPRKWGHLRSCGHLPADNLVQCWLAFICLRCASNSSASFLRAGPELCPSLLSMVPHTCGHPVSVHGMTVCWPFIGLEEVSCHNEFIFSLTPSSLYLQPLEGTTTRAHSSLLWRCHSKPFVRFSTACQGVSSRNLITFSRPF